MTKTNDWRERFEDNFGKWSVAKECDFKDLPFLSDIEDFIDQELKRQRDEIREWVMENFLTMEPHELIQFLDTLDNHENKNN